MSFYELEEDSQEFIAMSRRLRREGFKLKNLCYYDNPEAESRFQQELETFNTMRRGFDSNVKQLFHVTKHSEDKIAREGLVENLAFSNDSFGRGIFFSDLLTRSAPFCRQSSKEDYKGYKYVLVCSVILGKVKEYKPGVTKTSLKGPPVERTKKGKFVYYNSVVGIPTKFRLYSVYKDRRVIVDYVAYFDQITPKEKRRDEKNDDYSVSIEACKRNFNVEDEDDEDSEDEDEEEGDGSEDDDDDDEESDDNEEEDE